MTQASQPLRSIDGAYAVMLRLLRGLSAHGYTVPTLDGLELVHDFIVSEWPGIWSRFPDGVPEPYLAVSFRRFARRRIIAERKHQLLFSSEQPDDFATHEQDLPAIDLHRLGEALEQMPAAQRALLMARFGEDLTERELTARYRVSRYEVRRRMLEALAALAGRMSAEAGERSFVLEVAHRLFGAQLPLDSVAAALNTTRQRVRAARDAFLHDLGRGLP